MNMNLQKILNDIRNNDQLAIYGINKLSHADRRLLRGELDKNDEPSPRNLWYDYDLQCWID